MPATVAPRPSRTHVHRCLKRAAWSCGIVVFVVLIVLQTAFLILMNAGTAEYLINRFLLASSQRTLKMGSDPHLTLWPMLKVQLGPCTLSERNNTTPFARIESLEGTMQWAPLLGKQVLIPSLRMKGLFVTLTRDASGKLNIADLLEPRTDADTGWSFRVDLLALSHSHLRWRDQFQSQSDASFRAMDVDQLQLKAEVLHQPPAGQQGIMNGQISLSGHGYSPTMPMLDAKLELASNYTLDKPRQHYAAQNTQLDIDGQYETGMDGKVMLNIHETRLMPLSRTAEFHDLALSVKNPAGQHYGSLAVPRLDFSNRLLQAASLQIDAAHTFENGARTQARIVTPLTVDFEKRMLALDALETQLDIDAPQYLSHSLHLTGAGNIRAEMEQDQSMNMAAHIQGQVDRSPFNLHLKLARTPALRIETELDIQHMNLDAWLKPASASKAKPELPSKPELAWPIPSSLDFEGKLHAGTLTFSGIQMQQLHLLATSKNGLLKIHQLR